MPHITTERVSEIRKELKREFPNFKFSITKRHHSTVVVAILAAPFNMLSDETNERRYEGVNHFYINEHYKENTKVRDILLKIEEIINNGNYTVCQDSDYGAIPSFYIDIKIGDWDKPFIVKS